ncbi:MAG: AI-2E family transporter [Acidimicrobiales bacterium]
MTRADSGSAEPELFRSRWIHSWGRTGWSVVGVVLAAALLYALVAAISGLVIPLVIATVIGVLGVTVVDFLERLRVPRPAGAALFVVFLFVVLGGAIAVAVSGISDQGDEVASQMAAGIDAVGGWLESSDIDLPSGSSIVDAGSSQGWDLLPGAASYLGSIFSSAMAFLVGTLLAIFFLYYVLVDWNTLRTWVCGHLNMPTDLGRQIVDDSTSIVRQGFTALTLSSLVVSILIWITMVILDIPLAFTVALVTFVTSYIPYLGAIVSGAFGFLVALGSSGIEDALILLLVILIVQNVVQTVLGNKLTSDRLHIHPLASLIATIVGATVAGLLGAMLSSLVLAMVIAMAKRLSAARSELRAEVTDTTGPP